MLPIITYTKPIIEKAVEIEDLYKGQSNEFKKKVLFDLSWERFPELSNFLTKCGWKQGEFKLFLDLCVLIAKKPSAKLWNEDDHKMITSFAAIVIDKWLDMIGRRKL